MVQQLVPGVNRERVDLLVRSVLENREPDDPLENMLLIHGWIDEFAVKVREWKQLAEQRFIEALQAHGQDGYPAELEVGDMRYYVGTTRKVKPRDRGVILGALLEHCHGDLDAILRFLSSDPFKQGSIRTELGDEAHAELFETVEVADLKTGKPKRGLKQVNTQFLPRRGNPDAAQDTPVRSDQD